MKTLCFTLGLLLASVCCCHSLLDALEAAAPTSCCSEVTTHRVPPKFIFNITKTHSSCVNKAFIIQTVRGFQVCYSQTLQWAVNVYNRLHGTEETPQQNRRSFII